MFYSYNRAPTVLSKSVTNNNLLHIAYVTIRRNYFIAFSEAPHSFPLLSISWHLNQPRFNYSRTILLFNCLLPVGNFVDTNIHIVVAHLQIFYNIFLFVIHK